MPVRPGMEKADLLLLHPPLWQSFYGPHLAIPQLSGFLKAHGVKVLAKDLNILLFNTILSEEVFPVFWDECVDLANESLQNGRLTDEEKTYLLNRLQDIQRMKSLLFEVAKKGKSCLYDFCKDGNWYSKLDAFCSALFNLCNLYFYGKMQLAEELNLKDKGAFHKYEAFFSAYLLPQISDLLAHTTEWVGLSVSCLNQLIPALALVNVIREKKPSLKFVLGGALFALIEERTIAYILKQHKVRTVVLYEGEWPLLQICKHNDLSLAPNCYYLDGNNHVRKSPFSQSRVLLREMPLPDYTWFSPEDYFLLGKWQLPIMQSRGCYWGKCSYCNFTRLSQSSRYEEKPVEKLIREIEEVGPDLDKVIFSFVNDSITPKYCGEFSRAIIARGLKIRWCTFLRADKSFSAELLALMKEAGLSYVVLGAETLEDRMLKLVNKGNSSANVKFMIEKLQDLNIQSQINIILDLPTITFAEAKQTAEYLVQKVNPLKARISLFHFSLVVKSKMAEEPGLYGLRRQPSPKDEAIVYTSLPFESQNPLTKEEKERILKIYSDHFRSLRS